MKVRFRVIEKWWPDSQAWEPWGALYDNCSDHFRESKSLLLSSLAERKDLVQEFERRVETLGLDVEQCRRLLDGYTSRFRLSPMVEVMEGETFRDIHDRLWKRVFGPLWTESQPIESEVRIEYAAQPAYHSLRESDEGTTDGQAA